MTVINLEESPVNSAVTYSQIPVGGVFFLPTNNEEYLWKENNSDSVRSIHNDEYTLDNDEPCTFIGSANSWIDFNNLIEQRITIENWRTQVSEGDVMRLAQFYIELPEHNKDAFMQLVTHHTRYDFITDFREVIETLS